MGDTRRGDVSQPSTDDSLMNKTKPTSNKSLDPYSLFGDEDLSFLDPDEGYPVIDWEDLSDQQQTEVLYVYAHRMQASMGLHRIAPSTLRNFVERIVPVEDRLEGLEQVRKHLEATVALLDKALAGSSSKDIPAPARPGHLMAEGFVLEVARRAAANVEPRMMRAVSFREPVNAFTMLYGDQIAKPGDMLTGVTLRDTIPEETKTDSRGNRIVRHVTTAISL